MKASDVIERANRGIIGIDDQLQVFGGYDNDIEEAGATSIETKTYNDDYERMPREEKLRLADRMISLWFMYRAAAL